MKIFLFIDQSLESGHLISDDKNKKVKLDELKDFNDILFVFKFYLEKNYFLIHPPPNTLSP